MKQLLTNALRDDFDIKEKYQRCTSETKQGSKFVFSYKMIILGTDEKTKLNEIRTSLCELDVDGEDALFCQAKLIDKPTSPTSEVLQVYIKPKEVKPIVQPQPQHTQPQIEPAGISFNGNYSLQHPVGEKTAMHGPDSQSNSKKPKSKSLFFQEEVPEEEEKLYQGQSSNKTEKTNREKLKILEKEENELLNQLRLIELEKEEKELKAMLRRK